jgi:hypothetical protein
MYFYPLIESWFFRCIVLRMERMSSVNQSQNAQKTAMEIEMMSGGGLHRGIFVRH